MSFKHPDAVELKNKAGDPGAVASSVQLYAKANDFYVRDGAGNIVQVTTAGAVGGGGGGGGGEVTPSPKSAVGTTEQTVGSVYLTAATYNFRAIIGCVNAADTATIVVRRETTSAQLTTIGGVAGLLASRTSLAVVVAADDWYNFNLKGDVASAIALCNGVQVTK